MFVSMLYADSYPSWHGYSKILSYAQIYLIHLFPQVHGHSNFSLGDLVTKRSRKDTPHDLYEFSQSSLSDACLGTQQGIRQDSDESDSEIFRVKRRSSFKPGQRNVCHAISPNIQHQVAVIFPHL